MSQNYGLFRLSVLSLLLTCFSSISVFGAQTTTPPKEQPLTTPPALESNIPLNEAAGPDTGDLAPDPTDVQLNPKILDYGTGSPAIRKKPDTVAKKNVAVFLTTVAVATVAMLFVSANGGRSATDTHP